MPTPLQSTPFGTLIKKTLKVLDNYNSADLTRSTPSVDQNTSGEIAGIAINLALHTCYDLIKESKYLKALPTTSVVSTSGQDYIDLDILTNVDEIEALMDTANNIRLLRKSWHFYRKNYPDPSKITGIPIIYCRRDTRIYLAPRPQSSVTYTADFGKMMGDLVNDGDCPLLPTHYDYWIIAEARYQWAMMEDPDQIPQFFTDEREKAREIAVNAILSDYDLELEAESHWNENQTFFRDYQRPVSGGS